MLDVNLAEDVFPISQAQDSLRSVIQRASDTGRPMVITQNGRPVAAIVEIAEFERVRRLAGLAEDYREIILGQEGAWHAHEAVWAEIDRRLKRAGGGEGRGGRVGSERGGKGKGGRGGRIAAAP